jgi:hypothetical protein
MHADLVERVRSVLGTRDLSLYQVSRASETLYGRRSPYFVPHNFYHDLGLETFSPSLFQLCALSRITGYLFADWLRLCNFDLTNIPRLQIALSSNRTILLDSTHEDLNAWIPWFRSRHGNLTVPPIAPLAQLLEFAQPVRVSSLPQRNEIDYLYVRIGQRDALAFPDLIPGSVVRVNPNFSNDLLPRLNGTISERLFLIQHALGFSCCRIYMVGKNRIIPVSTQLPYAQVELQLSTEARLLGVVDLEIRPWLKTGSPEVPKEFTRQWTPTPVVVVEPKLGTLLRNARVRAGMSFREASHMSRQVADLLSDERYFISASSLSNYEIIDLLPRHFHKMLTVSVLYGVPFNTLLKVGGIVSEDTGKEPIPDYLVPRLPSVTSSRARAGDSQPNSNGFLQDLLNRCGQIPLFLWGSLDTLTGLAQPSLHNFFWVGGQKSALHPHLAGALIVVIDRQQKKPPGSSSKPLWLQPLYIILKHDGSYACGCCTLENGLLLLHPYSERFQRVEQFRNRKDAEVVGQVVTIARMLL